MENKAIETINKFPIRMRDLRGIAPDILAALSISSMAATECNVLMRLFLDASHPPSGNEEIDRIAHTHRGVIQRTWSAKLFEFWEFMGLKKNYHETSCLELRSIVLEARGRYETTLETEGGKVARYFRNVATNHYSLSAARDSLRYTADSSDISMYLHSSNGNCCFTMGEVVFILGGLNRMNKGGQFSDLSQIYVAWEEWNQEGTNLIGEFHANLVSTFVLPHLKDRSATETKHYVPYAMVGEFDQPTSPLFMRRTGRVGGATPTTPK